MPMLQGQGHDEANNMLGEYNSIKKGIPSENNCSFYIHFLAHQLKLVVFVVARIMQILATCFHQLLV